MSTIKLQDTSPIIGENSRLEAYWKQTGFTDFFRKFRKGMKLPAKVQTVDSVDKLIKLFKLHAVGFGNWVNQEDRYNYLSALIIAFYDLDKVLRFNNNIGLNGTVSVSFGARGKGAAVAHFESKTFIINVTRYVESSEISKADRFAQTGGVGAIAHEYGHALDYYFGLFIDRSSSFDALSGGRSTRQALKQLAGTVGYLRTAMDDLLNAIIWKKQFTEQSDYYKRLTANFKGDYMFRRNEIFARTFEKYIQYKLSLVGISNSFLNDTKYDSRAYMTDAEIKHIVPQMDHLVNLMRRTL